MRLEPLLDGGFEVVGGVTDPLPDCRLAFFVIDSPLVSVEFEDEGDMMGETAESPPIDFRIFFRLFGAVADPYPDPDPDPASLSRGELPWRVDFGESAFEPFGLRTLEAALGTSPFALNMRVAGPKSMDLARFTNGIGGAD